MPLSVSAVLNKRHTLPIDVDDEQLTVSYRPYTVSEREAMLERMRDDATAAESAAVEFLASILLGWDLQTAPDDPTPYPTDYASLCKLPGEFVALVLQRIGEAQTVSKPSSADS